MKKQNTATKELHLLPSVFLLSIWYLLFWCEHRHWAYLKKREITFFNCFYPYAFLY